MIRQQVINVINAVLLIESIPGSFFYYTSKLQPLCFLFTYTVSYMFESVDVPKMFHSELFEIRSESNIETFYQVDHNIEIFYQNSIVDNLLLNVV